MATLKLTLSKKPFEVMLTREKCVEFRKMSPWMKSRLFDKQNKPKSYDYVEFTNGYGKTKPKFICKFITCKVIDKVEVSYSNGLTISIQEPTYCIFLGAMKE